MTCPAPNLVDSAREPSPLRLVAGFAPAEDIERLVALRLREGRAGHLRFLRSRLRSPEDAEDVLQEFALRAIQGASRVADPGKVDAWLNVGLRNALFDRYRRNAGRARLAEAVRGEPVSPADDDDDLERPLACLAKAVSGLKPEVAALLRRAELQEAPLKVVAEELAITANNAGVRVHRAREALRRAMHARCSDCAAPCPLAIRFVGRPAA